jgi:hypothetical protein
MGPLPTRSTKPNVGSVRLPKKAVTASSIVTLAAGSRACGTAICSIVRSFNSARSQLRVFALSRIVLPFNTPRIHFGQRQRR